MRVLYVDDDRINALLFSETCRIAGGIEVETAGTAAEALELVAAWPPDLLVIDLHLPDGTGTALLPQLRDRAQRPALPAYLCSATETSDLTGTATAAGFTGCWSKPVVLEAMLAAIRQHGPAA